ncbi:hypothetical protein DPMN_001961 [Dreissena polymorpha]|uniref:Uncharacterized protein n=1 Tax=Dreissena polymorpha TaxID=45954 RepID=A0A9D4MLX6_DREPO|nr:hypothetical protein DPMN_001961 [Dreissena polymorpha]
MLPALAKQQCNGGRGQPQRKRVKRATKNIQERLHSLCQDYSGGRKTLAKFLQAVGNCVRWKQ